MNNIKLIIIIFGIMFGVNEINFKEIENLPLSEPRPIEKFMNKISQMESGGNHRIVNQYGMMGKYQFSMPAIRAVGLRISREQFLRNPDIQDTAMVRLLALHERYLENYIERYDGKTVKGVKITRAAILAGAHFAGAQGVKNFFISQSRTGAKDGNGTTLRYYMSKFSDFHLPAINETNETIL